MKKRVLALLLAMVVALSLSACGDSGGGAASSDGGASDSRTTVGGVATASDLNVGVFYYNYGDTYIASVRTALDAALDARSITYTDYDGNNTQGTQNDQIRTAITSGCNLLVVNMVTSGAPDAATTILETAGDIPVIFFNRAIDTVEEPDATLKENDHICFIGTDAPEAGHLQGQMVGNYILDHYDKIDLNGDGVISYAMFKGDESNIEAIYRTQYGQEDADAVLTAAGKPAMVYFDANNTSRYQVDQTGAWSSQAGVDYMTTNLSQFNEGNGNMIEIIICNNDNMAEGCISALNAAGYNDGSGKTIPVFGVDATESAQELIAAGKMTGSVKQDAEGMAISIAETASSIGAGATMADAIAAAAAMDAERYTIAEGVSNKLYVAYAPYMG